jgi:hypothetical protein
VNKSKGASAPFLSLLPREALSLPGRASSGPGIVPVHPLLDVEDVLGGGGVPDFQCVEFAVETFELVASDEAGIAEFQAAPGDGDEDYRGESPEKGRQAIGLWFESLILQRKI